MQKLTIREDGTLSFNTFSDGLDPRWPLYLQDLWALFQWWKRGDKDIAVMFQSQICQKYGDC